jgi:hypothetical protein
MRRDLWRPLRSFSRLCTAVVGVALLATGATAQTTQRATPLQTMEREARVSKDVARATALSKVPGGRMSSIELRRGVGGKLVYNASIAVAWRGSSCTRRSSRCRVRRRRPRWWSTR